MGVAYIIMTKAVAVRKAPPLRVWGGGQIPNQFQFQSSVHRVTQCNSTTYAGTGASVSRTSS